MASTTKQDLINECAQAAGVTKKVAATVLETFAEVVKKQLKKGGKVTWTGFGTFMISKRAARTGVNPRDPKQKIKIPAMNLPVFRAGKTLKEGVR